jgi:hypothetical protein
LFVDRARLRERNDVAFHPVEYGSAGLVTTHRVVDVKLHNPAGSNLDHSRAIDSAHQGHSGPDATGRVRTVIISENSGSSDHDVDGLPSTSRNFDTGHWTFVLHCPNLVSLRSR